MKEKPGVIEALPPHLTTDDVRFLLTSLHQGANEQHLREILDLSPEEYSAILDDPVFKQKRREHAIPRMRQDIQREVTWDILETSALQKTAELLPRVDDPEVAARIAKTANAAKRPIKDNAPRHQLQKPSAPNPSVAVYTKGVITLGADETRARFEELHAREQEVIDRTPRRVHDVASVEDIESFLGKEAAAPEVADLQAEDITDGGGPAGDPYAPRKRSE